MTHRLLIINADNFGLTKPANKAVLDGYHNGFLKSASLTANGSAFNAAVNEIIPECPNLSIGIHLNLSKGYSLTKAPMLTNKKGVFNNNFLQILFKSNNKEIQKQIEFEFRTQIETVSNYTKISHIDSYNNIHIIPEIFEITAKLAQEFNIPYIRNHYEELFVIKDYRKNIRLPINFIKMLFLNYFYKKNKAITDKYNLKSNDFIISTLYNGIMDCETIESGLKMIDNKSCITEVVIYPANYNLVNRNNEYKQFLIIKNKELNDKISRLGFEISNFNG